jgi:hypothetical protein
MDSTNRHQSEREAHKAQANRAELVERIMRAIPEDGAAEPLEGLLLNRASAPTGLGIACSSRPFASSCRAARRFCWATPASGTTPRST